jgi:hypothetical protein
MTGRAPFWRLNFVPSDIDFMASRRRHSFDPFSSIAGSGPFLLVKSPLILRSVDPELVLPRIALCVWRELLEAV